MPKQDHEFVAGKAGADVLFADHRAEHRADRTAGAVAGFVSVGVVDFLEPVEVENDQAGGAPLLRGAFDAALALPVQGPATGETSWPVLPV